MVLVLKYSILSTCACTCLKKEASTYARTFKYFLSTYHAIKKFCNKVELKSNQLKKMVRGVTINIIYYTILWRRKVIARHSNTCVIENRNHTFPNIPPSDQTQLSSEHDMLGQRYLCSSVLTLIYVFNLDISRNSQTIAINIIIIRQKLQTLLWFTAGENA